MATVIAHTPSCPGGNCPTTYAHPEPGKSYVQGYAVADPLVLAEFNIPGEDALVTLPDSVLADHVQAVGARPNGLSSSTCRHPEPGMSYVQGALVTDLQALAEFNIPDGEALVVVRDALLADQVMAVRA
jgi:hypothetical protein